MALPIAALLAVAAAATLLGTWRLGRRTASTHGSARELRHAQATFETELRPLRAADIHAVSDTAIEIDALVGVGAVCATVAGPPSTGHHIDVVSADPLDPLGLSWASGVRPSDGLTLWRVVPDSVAVLGELRTAVRDTRWGAACASTPWLAGWADRRTVRITVADIILTPIVVGTPVAVRRRTRWSLYRSGSLWYLGRRARSGGAWEIIQPVAGPFLSAGQGGMLLRLLDGAGHVTANLSNAAAVRVELRSERVSDGRAAATRDTVIFDVVLRAESAHRRR